MNLIGYDSDSCQSPILSQPTKKRKRQYCCYCKRKLTRETYTKDHIYPKSLGGTFTLPCCKRCNYEKKDMTLIQYAQFIGKRMYAMVQNEKRDTWGYKKCERQMKNIERFIKKDYEAKQVLPDGRTRCSNALESQNENKPLCV